MPEEKKQQNPEEKKISSGDRSGKGRERRDDDVMKGDRSAAELGLHEGGSKNRQ